MTESGRSVLGWVRYGRVASKMLGGLSQKQVVDGRLRPCHTPLNMYLQHTKNTTDANCEFCLTTLQFVISLTSYRHHCDTHDTSTCPLLHVILVTPTTLSHFHSLMSSRHPGDTHDTPTCPFRDVIPPSW